RQCASNCVGGLEFYVGIPGSVGGAVAMNAGGHNCQTSDVLRSTNCLSLETGDFVNFDKDLCNFDYRKSRFTNSDFIVDATFEGFKRDEETIKERLDEIVKWRRENQPGGRNVGSVFQNPADCSAGELIEKAGLKGFSIGGAQVSEKHANFIQAAQDAKAQDIYDLIGHVKKHIFETTGYDLKTEVRYIGNYGK
ncbi:MAG: UDP-N-acetylmuramate dehydrogenase, partial [Acidimicrobiia bacterium]